MSQSNASKLEINLPETVAGLKAAFENYETALMENDPATLVNWFWDSPHAIRYGVAENLYGFDEISNYRSQKADSGGAPKRNTVRTTITTYGTDFGTTNIEFLREKSQQLGRQSQTWMRKPEGWRIVAAHVSLNSDNDL